MIKRSWNGAERPLDFESHTKTGPLAAWSAFGKIADIHATLAVLAAAFAADQGAPATHHGQDGHLPSLAVPAPFSAGFRAGLCIGPRPCTVRRTWFS